MVTEAQKKVFKENLDKVFEVIKNAQETGEIKITSQLRKWLTDQHTRYKNYKNNVNPKHILPHDHLITLEKKLNEENLTLKDFETTQGRIELLVETIKTKSISKEMTLEDMIEFRDKTEEECRDLERKLNKRKLFRLTEEECTEYQRKIDEFKLVIRDINKKIEELTPKEEVKEEKLSDGASKKIEELISQNNEQAAEINSLKEEVAKYREERAYISSKYRAEYDKKLQIYEKEKDQELKEKVQEELQKQIVKSAQKEEENKQLQKTYIRKLLVKGIPLSLEDIKTELKLVRVPSTKIEIALSELRNEIPGLIKRIDKDGQMQTYLIGASATNRCDALKKFDVSPRISNVFTGTVKFFVRADLHLPLTLSEDKMRSVLNPSFEFCSTNGNIPIVDLGDVGDTLKGIPYKRWQNMDPEAMELAYNFFRIYSKIISSAKNIKHLQLIGNHGKHGYLVGLDPVEIMNNYADNITFLGIDKGSIMLGNDKIGVFHGIDSVPFSDNLNLIPELVQEELKKIARNYIYSLVAHYHMGLHNPINGYSLIDNSHENPLLFTAELEDGHVKKMYVQALRPNEKRNSYRMDCYPVEIYNAEYQYKKKSH